MILVSLTPRGVHSPDPCSLVRSTVHCLSWVFTKQLNIECMLPQFTHFLDCLNRPLLDAQPACPFHPLLPYRPFVQGGDKPSFKNWISKTSYSKGQSCHKVLAKEAQKSAKNLREGFGFLTEVLSPFLRVLLLAAYNRMWGQRWSSCHTMTMRLRAAQRGAWGSGKRVSCSTTRSSGPLHFFHEKMTAVVASLQRWPPTDYASMNSSLLSSLPH